MKSRFHPATVLLAWGTLAVGVQFLPLTGLLLATSVFLLMALVLAGSRTRLFLKRSRWLLLSIVVLFVVATPGERLSGWPGDLGLSVDGIQQATEHLCRLLLLICSLALLHERLGTQGFLVGMYCLLAPLRNWKNLRERIVVRLMLVLAYVETSPRSAWRDLLQPPTRASDEPVDPPRDEETLSLPVPDMRWADWSVVLLTIGIFLALWTGV